MEVLNEGRERAAFLGRQGQKVIVIGHDGPSLEFPAIKDGERLKEVLKEAEALRS